MNYRRNKALQILSSVLLFLAFASSAFAQWTGKVILPQSTNGQPALATLQGQLYLAWAGTDSQSTINVMSSSDGLNYGNLTFPGLHSQGGFGPGLSAVPNCGALYVSAVVGGNATVTTSQSSDGVNWTAPAGSLNAAFSTPVLNGAYSTYGSVAFRDTGGNPRSYDFTDCTGMNAAYDCFYFSGSCQDSLTPLIGAPAFAGPPVGGRKSFSLSDGTGHLYVGSDSGGWISYFGNWSQDGPSMAYDPVTGNVYMAWRGSGGGINISNVLNGQNVISNDWSYNTPVIAVFQGQLFVAWRGGGNAVNVAKLNLF